MEVLWVMEGWFNYCSIQREILSLFIVSVLPFLPQLPHFLPSIFPHIYCSLCARLLAADRLRLCQLPALTFWWESLRCKLMSSYPVLKARQTTSAKKCRQSEEGAQERLINPVTLLSVCRLQKGGGMPQTACAKA